MLSAGHIIFGIGNSIREQVQSIGLSRVLIVLVTCLGLRLALFVFVQPWTPEIEANHVLVPDGSGYHRLATSLLEDRRFAGGYFVTDEPESLRTPLYPMFIALIYFLFGFKPWAVILTQIMMDTATCLLLLMLFARLFSATVALIASLFYALNPQLIYLASTTLRNETLFVFLLVTAFGVLWAANATDSQRDTLLLYGLSGLLLGLATLTKPISQYILICYLVFFVVAYWKQPRSVVMSFVLCTAGFVLILSPWLWRNYRMLGSPSLSSSSSYNLLQQGVTSMEMKKRHEDYWAVRKALLAEADQMIMADGLRPEELNAFQKAKYWRELAISYISADPFAFTKSYVQGLVYTIFGPGTSSYMSLLRLPAARVEVQAFSNLIDLAKAFLEEKGWAGLLVAGVLVIFLLIAFLGGVIGLLIGWRRYDKSFLLLAILLALYFVLLSALGGEARYRVPAIPFYLLFTGIGYSYLYEKTAARKTIQDRIRVWRASFSH